jgi:hypothetical protein
MKTLPLRSLFRKAALGAAFVVLALAPAAATEPVLISYEASPSHGFDLPKLPAASYAVRAAFAVQALSDIVPKIAHAVGVDDAKIVSEVTPGGYLLKTNASLQTMADLDDAAADRFAAALGYVFRQDSVLVSRLDEPTGATDFVTVTFPRDKLNSTVAQAFFEKAASIEKGLGGGYTAFGDDQIFLNVTDSEGKPYSGLDHAAFLAGLTRAAAEFGPLKPTVSNNGKAVARFVGNDWQAQPEGEGYVARLGGPASPVAAKLDAISADYAALVEAAAKRYGWK